MKTKHGIAAFSALLLLLTACSNSTETQTADSGKVAVDSAMEPLVLRESANKTATGDSIVLQKGEWYARGKYVDYDKDRGILIFELEDGNAREITSNAWNRNGKMQVSAKEDIFLKKGEEYEFIYYFQFENAQNQSEKPSGFYLSEIIPQMHYFKGEGRYKGEVKNKPFKHMAQCCGKFWDDLNGGALVVESGRELPVIYYSKSPSSEKTQVGAESFLSNALKTQLPSEITRGFLTFLDGNWIYSDGNSTRRIFRPAHPE